ncbi:MAG: bifunctional nuclease domain-containing protein, partial [Actinomycetota bacterium]
MLRESGGDRYLPIWIGAVEATAIAFAQQGVVPARPLTHDLIRDVLDALESPLQEIR